MVDIENISRNQNTPAIDRQGPSEHDQAQAGFVKPGPERRPAVGQWDARVRVEEIDDVEQLHRHIYAWRGLAAFSISANPCHEAFLLEPVLRHCLKDARNLKSILIWQDNIGNAPAKLIGFFIIQRQSWRWGISFRFARSGSHFFTFSGTPLIHKLHADAALDGFFNWARTQGNLGTFLFCGISGKGPFFEALRTYLTRTRHQFKLVDRHERAYLRTSLSGEDYLSQSLSRKRRKEFRRLRARLAEQGELTSSFYDRSDDIATWIEAYFELEAEGWKGRAGTAFLCREDWSAAMRASLIQAFKDGRGMFWKLTLDGKPIAMSFGFKAGRRAWLTKISHDDTFSQYSPGTLLILDITETITGRADIDSIDSCAVPDHPMINHIWRERLVVTDLLVDVGETSNVRFYLAFRLEMFRRRGRAYLKQCYHYLKNRGWSS
jgi:Acetyltransferase (GNAT) domain